MAHLSLDELQVILQKLDEVCRQAQELQKQIKERMLDRARRDHAASSAAPLKERRSRSRKVAR